MFWKILKIAAAILFFPVVIAVTKAFFLSLNNLGLLGANLFLVAGGFCAYPIFHIVFFKPMYIYTIGHEIVHVLATWISRGKVTSFHVSKNGGSVTTTKTNLFIRLSPYFVPIHVIALFLVYLVASRFYNMSAFFNEFLFLIGFTLSFHIFMTIEVMKLEQPDIARTGFLFSILFIYVTNVAITLLVLSFIFNEITFLPFTKNTFIFAKNIYLNIFGKLF